MSAASKGAQPGGVGGPLTLEALAAEKKLPVEFLRDNGLENHPSGRGVVIAYFDENGKQHERMRLRTAPRAKDGSVWLGDKNVKPIAYGSWHLKEARDKGYIILVEGETDALTLWFHNYPALGMPGASMSKTLLPSYLLDIQKIFVVREPDTGGDTFIAKLADRLNELHFTGEVFEISLDGFKDPSELHCDYPERFDVRFDAVLNHATLLNIAAPVGNNPAPERAVTTALSEIEAEEVEWLWEHRIPLGKLTIIAGDPGLGKSFVTLDIAASISLGRDFPDCAICRRGSVLIVSAEDGIADTVRPRLDAQGADVARIYRLTITKDDSERQFNLETHLELLKKKLREMGDVRAVIIDPLTAYLGETDPNKDARVRALLTPLASLAEEMRVAIIAIMHLNKAAVMDVIYRVTGSVAFIAQARAAWAVVEDPQNASRRLFIKLKGNLARAEVPGLAFTIREDERRRARLEWESEPVTVSLRDVMGGFSNTRRPRGPKPNKSETAKAFLQEALAGGGWHASNPIIERAEDQGIRYSTLTNARKELAHWRKKPGLADGWEWCLKSTSSTSHSNNSASSANPLGENGSIEVANSASSAKNTEGAEFMRYGKSLHLGDQGGRGAASPAADARAENRDRKRF
jgi:archaellum biogenesis ATPase FlaH